MLINASIQQICLCCR